MIITYQNWTDDADKKKAFGYHVARLSKKAGVPWQVAACAGEIEDKEKAIYVLEKVRKARELLDPRDYKTRVELGCTGKRRRIEAIKKLLGEEVFSLLYCESQRRSMDLARYLLGG